MARFGYAEPHLCVWSFFLHALATRITRPVPLYWRLTPAECRPFFRKPRLIDDQNCIWTAQLFHNVMAQFIPRRVCIPTGPVQQMLHPRIRFLHPLSQLPAILALPAAQQAL